MLDRYEHGQPRRKLLEAVADRNPRAAAELEGPPLPEALAYLWHWFRELAATRTGSGFGPNPVSWAEMEAWARLNRLRLSPFERLALVALDGAYLAAAAKKR